MPTWLVVVATAALIGGVIAIERHLREICQRMHVIYMLLDEMRRTGENSSFELSQIAEKLLGIRSAMDHYRENGR